jgi:DNA-binding response OmpR family regulator
MTSDIANSKPQLLLVEDDVELAGLMTRLFAAQVIEVTWVSDLASARAALRQTPGPRVFDLLVLDIMLPDGNGLDLCRDVRSVHPSLPVLMLSARGDTIDRVLGLEIGADDYIAKPFDGAELIARARALLRRVRFDRLGQSATSPTHKHFGELTIDLLARAVTLRGSGLELTSTEYKLLLALCQTPGKPISRDALSRTIQPGSYMPSDRSVDVQVARLRKKIREMDEWHDWVSTVRGEGYVFTVPASSTPTFASSNSTSRL